MTIAAGFVCSDGVVLCSDTLLSANFRQQGPKAWVVWKDSRVALAVAGAGNYVLLKLAREALLRRMTQLRRNTRKPLDPGRIQHEVIEPVIASIHDDHVDKATEWDRANGYGLSLLVAVQEGGIATLYETDRRACSKVLSFACVGSGAPIGNYVASTTFTSVLASSWGEMAAAYVIQQAKAYGDDCGGDTAIIVLPNDGKVEELSLDRIRKLEAAGFDIHKAVARLLVANTDKNDEDLFKRFSDLRDVVIGVSNWITVESGKAAEAIEHTFIHFKRPLRSQEDRPIRKAPKRGRKRQPALRE